ncbi:MAG: hypothetical protein U5L00_14860 [Desulfovermiculus sp.]|nr:hypothetical protein [Desulfovermiculus sp.]
MSVNHKLLTIFEIKDRHVEVYAYGTLQPVFKDTRDRLEDVHPDAQLPLTELLHRLDISRDQVQLVMLNHRPAAMDAIVSSGDRVALFPPEYPIFADWKHYRR